MNRTLIAGIALACAAGGALASDTPKPQTEPRVPVTMSRQAIAGEIFRQPQVITATENGNTTLDITTFLSSDRKFASGMYQSGKLRLDINEPYGVDEFIFLVEGSLTLISADGTRQEIGAGESVTIPKEWTGVWQTDGYRKIWVIYSEDGSGL